MKFEVHRCSKTFSRVPDSNSKVTTRHLGDEALSLVSRVPIRLHRRCYLWVTPTLFPLTLITGHAIHLVVTSSTAKCGDAALSTCSTSPHRWQLPSNDWHVLGSRRAERLCSSPWPTRNQMACTAPTTSSTMSAMRSWPTTSSPNLAVFHCPAPTA